MDVVILNDRSKNGEVKAEANDELPRICTLDMELRFNEVLKDKLRWTFDPKFDYPFGWRVGC